MKRASMDIGSNTVRLLLARDLFSGPADQTILRRITRLGGKFTGQLDPDSAERTRSAVRDFAAVARGEGVDGVRVGCTGVVRKASDRGIFLTSLRGIDSLLNISILTGDTEARLSALGAARHLGPDFGPLLMIDIGGFSTELAVVDTQVRRRSSLDLGVVALTETYLKDDPPTPTQVAAVRAAVRAAAEPFFREPVPPNLVGIAGTATTVAAMHQELDAYDPAKIHRHRVPASAMAELFERLVAVPSAERLAAVKGLEKGREDLMPAGLLILEAVMELGGFDALMVSEGGLLDGILLSESWPPEGSPDA